MEVIGITNQKHSSKRLMQHKECSRSTAVHNYLLSMAHIVLIGPLMMVVVVVSVKETDAEDFGQLLRHHRDVFFYREEGSGTHTQDGHGSAWGLVLRSYLVTSAAAT